MTTLLGYLSSLFVNLGLGIGFVAGGFIFVFLIGYGLMLFFKRSRRMVREEETRNYAPNSRRMVPIRTNPRRPNKPVSGVHR